MKVELKKEEVVENETLDPNEPAGEETPSVEQPAPEPSSDAQRLRELELQNAKLEGQISTLQSISQPSKSVENQTQVQQNAWKATVLADINGMPDEDFRTKYKFEKYQATAAILEQEMLTKSAKTDRQVAELTAENRLVAKYGKDFMAVRSEVDEMVALASPEVRQDPVRLEKLMEKAYLASSRDKKSDVEPMPKPKGTEMKRIIQNFEKPTPAPSSGKRNEPEKDELPVEYRDLGRALKLTSEKERQELMANDFVPMQLGGGLVFKDPSRGVEKIA